MPLCFPVEGKGESDVRSQRDNEKEGSDGEGDDAWPGRKRWTQGAGGIEACKAAVHPFLREEDGGGSEEKGKNQEAGDTYVGMDEGSADVEADGARGDE